MINLFIRNYKRDLMQKHLKLDTTDKKPVRYLYHVSDVHIRNRTRHQEYTTVFSRLYDALREEKSRWKDNESGLIVMTGDIVHSKSQILPTLNIVLRDFLINLGSIMPVIMIAGNHDLNLANLDEPDTLSSVLHKAPIDGVHYLKNSGIYQWNNVQFGVMSVLDYPLIKSSQFPGETAGEWERIVKVGLLHATLHGSRVCTSTTPLTSERYKAGDFDGYDCVLLGDIHLHQFMNAKRTIAYAGSLVQQSFGEQLRGHGYLKWDLTVEDGQTMAKLVEIPNPWGFLNLVIRRGEIGPLELAESIRRDDGTIPRRVHVRIRILDATPNGLDIAEEFIRNMKVKDYIIEQKMIVPYSPTLDRDESGDHVAGLLSDAELPNLSNPEYQRSLIEEYLGSDHELLTEIQDLHDGFNRVDAGMEVMVDGGDDSGVTAYNWDLVSMEFHNAFSFRGTNFIDFKDFGGIVGIIGPNFSGKSNILDIILFALFDHASRGERNDIITANQREMYIKLVFKIGPMSYTIHRIGKVAEGKDGLLKTKIDVRFFNTQRDLTGENRLQTNKVISSYIGNYDDFVLTTLKLQQGGVGDLISLSNSARKDRLVDLLRLNVLDEYYKSGWSKLKDNKKALEIYGKELDALPADLAGRLESVLDKLIGEKTEMNGVKRKIEERENGLNDLSVKLQHVDMSLVDVPYIDEIPEIDVKSIRELDGTLSKLGERIGQLQSKLKPLNYGMTLNELEENIDLYRSTIVEHEEKIKEQEKREKNDKMLLDALRENQRDYKRQLKDWDNLWKRKIELSEWIRRTREGAEKLLSLEYDPNCKFCVNNPFVKEANDCRDRLEEREKELDQLEEQVGELEGIRSDLKDVEEEIEKIQLVLNQGLAMEMEIEIKTWNEELNGLREDYKNLRANKEIDEQIGELNRERTRIQDERDSLWEIWEKGQLMLKVKREKEKHETNRMFELRITELRKELDELKRRRTVLENSIMKGSAEEQMWGAQIERQRDLDLKIRRLRDENVLLEIYCKCLAKDGIPKYMIEKYMPEFERIVNLIMSDLVNFNIKMDIGDKKWNLYVVYDDRQLNIDLCSGYEKFIVGLAIKCALHHMSQISKPRFMIIDEGFGALDTNNLSEIGRIFNYLRSKYRFILLITHIDSIKDDLDMQLEIKKYGEYSRVNNKVTKRVSLQMKTPLRFKSRDKKDEN